jgi:hypothetical protein
VLAVELSAKAGGSRWLFPWQGPADLHFIFFRHLWGCTVSALLRQHTRYASVWLPSVGGCA